MLVGLALSKVIEVVLQSSELSSSRQSCPPVVRVVLQKSSEIDTRAAISGSPGPALTHSTTADRSQSRLLPVASGTPQICATQPSLLFLRPHFRRLYHSQRRRPSSHGHHTGKIQIKHTVPGFTSVVHDGQHHIYLSDVVPSTDYGPASSPQAQRHS